MTGDTALYSGRFAAALSYAATLHYSQVRKSDSASTLEIPYVAHLLEVSALVWYSGGSEAQAVAGLLHDALEDQGHRTSAGEIADLFGSDVARMVQACTDGGPDLARDRSTWLARKVGYLVHVYDASQPLDALLVTAADKVSNARAILDDYDEVHDRLWDRFNSPRHAIAWYYRETLLAIESRDPNNGLLPRLRPLVRRIEQITGGSDLRAAFDMGDEELTKALAPLTAAKLAAGI